jgi:glutamine amidotransferase
VHAYHYQCKEEQDVLNSTSYENKFVSAIEKDHVFGVQYHPEKSHQTGMQLFKNFLAL